MDIEVNTLARSSQPEWENISILEKIVSYTRIYNVVGNGVNPFRHELDPSPPRFRFQILVLPNPLVSNEILQLTF